MAARVGQITVSLRGLSASGFGLGRPEIRLIYGGRRYDEAFVDDETELDLVLRPTADTLTVYQNGVPLRQSTGRPDDRPPGLEFFA